MSDEQWGIEALPCCPNCKSNSDVGVHGWQTNHFSRLVIGLKNNYSVMTRRYKCHKCKDENFRLKRQIQSVATRLMTETNNMNIEIIKPPSYTFM